MLTIDSLLADIRTVTRDIDNIAVDTGYGYFLDELPTALDYTDLPNHDGDNDDQLYIAVTDLDAEMIAVVHLTTHDTIETILTDPFEMTPLAVISTYASLESHLNAIRMHAATPLLKNLR